MKHVMQWVAVMAAWSACGLGCGASSPPSAPAAAVPARPAPAVAPAPPPAVTDLRGGGCPAAADSAIIAATSIVDPRVKNGTAFDCAALGLRGIGRVIVPHDAAIVERPSGDSLVIHLQKKVAFAGHPPNPVNPEVARRNMGVAWRLEQDALTLATFGEWDSHIEGGASMTLQIEVPAGLATELRTGLSGENSAALSDEGATEHEPGYWYAPGAPATGWTALSTVPDSAAAERRRPPAATAAGAADPEALVRQVVDALRTGAAKRYVQLTASEPADFQGTPAGPLSPERQAGMLARRAKQFGEFLEKLSDQGVEPSTMTVVSVDTRRAVEQGDVGFAEDLSALVQSGKVRIRITLDDCVRAPRGWLVLDGLRLRSPPEPAPR